MKNISEGENVFVKVTNKYIYNKRPLHKMEGSVWIFQLHLCVTGGGTDMFSSFVWCVSIF